MKQFNALLTDIVENGRESSNRTVKRSKKVFGRQLRWNLAEGFPLVTNRKIFTRGVFTELEWFIKGLTNNQWLTDRGVHIWDEWALADEHLDMESPQLLPGADRYDLYFAKLLAEKGQEAVDAESIRFNGNKDVQPLSSEEGHRIMDEAGIPKYRTYRDLGFELGDLGPVYGRQWTAFRGQHQSIINQLKDMEDTLLSKPMSRRMIVIAWNPDDLPDESVSPQQNVLNGKMALAACHTLFQLFVDEATLKERIDWLGEIMEDDDNLRNNYTELLNQYNYEYGGTDFAKMDQISYRINGHLAGFDDWGHHTLDELKIPKLRLSLQLYQRSLDTPIGGPFNIASYAALTHIFANVADMIPGEFVWSTGDTHFYLDQLDCIKEQLSRDPKPLPKLKIKRKLSSVFDFTASDLEVIGYDPHPKIEYPDPAV